MMMCSRCKKRPAVMFISTMTAGERKNEGLCINCAKELGLPQVNEYLQQMGISEDTSTARWKAYSERTAR